METCIHRFFITCDFSYCLPVTFWHCDVDLRTRAHTTLVLHGTRLHVDLIKQNTLLLMRNSYLGNLVACIVSLKNLPTIKTSMCDKQFGFVMSKQVILW